MIGTKEHYRRTLIPMQLAILAICAVLYFKAKMPVMGILVYFAIMQAGSFVGALWATRMKRKFEKMAPRPLYKQ
jgi:hypothetical protein